MIVVADTSPLNYLIQIECDSLLRELYNRVVIPEAVLLELRHTMPSPNHRFLHALLRRLTYLHRSHPAAVTTIAEQRFLLTRRYECGCDESK